jgi:hypothetical protein
LLVALWTMAKIERRRIGDYGRRPKCREHGPLRLALNFPGCRMRPRPCDNRIRPAMPINGADKSARVSRPDRRDQRPHSEYLDHPLHVICQYMQAKP